MYVHSAAAADAASARPDVLVLFPGAFILITIIITTGWRRSATPPRRRPGRERAGSLPSRPAGQPEVLAPAPRGAGAAAARVAPRERDERGVRLAANRRRRIVEQLDEAPHLCHGLAAGPVPRQLGREGAHLGVR